MMFRCRRFRQAGVNRKSFAFCFLVLLMSAVPCVAHEINPALVDLSFREDGRYDLTVKLNLEALMAEIGPEHSDTAESANSAKYEALRARPPEELRDEFERFRSRFLNGIRVRGQNGQMLQHEVSSVLSPEVGDTDLARISTIVLESTARVNGDRIVWSWDGLFGANIIRVVGPEGQDSYSAYLTDGAPSDPIPVTGGPQQGMAAVIANYLKIGFTHILPLGLDHILFVVGLFLLSTALRPLILQVTSFTVAHTITLALGFLDIVQIPASIVEPLIAASIVYVCIENIMTDELHKWRTVVVFCFGLLHGLGFAGVLSDVGVSSTYFITALLAFNIGVELGQLAVIAGCFVVFGWFRHQPWYRAVVTIPASAVIGLIGAYWFVQRISLAL